VPTYTFTLNDNPGIWEDVEDAIRTWVKVGSGFGDQYVIWAEQDGPRPDDVYIALALDGPTRVHHDEVVQTYDGAAAAGQEIVQTVRGVRRLTAKLTCFYGDASGNAAARAVLADLITALELPSVRSMFLAAGLGLADVGPVRNVPAVRAPLFEGRATLDVDFHLIAELAERTGYIASAQLKGTVASDKTIAGQYVAPTITKVVP
jgi:hypothetical protein